MMPSPMAPDVVHVGSGHDVECRGQAPSTVLRADEAVILQVVVAVAAQDVEHHASEELAAVRHLLGAVPAEEARHLGVGAVLGGVVVAKGREAA